MGVLRIVHWKTKCQNRENWKNITKQPGPTRNYKLNIEETEKDLENASKH